jgi:tetratricopeptide (TPR) repeat protein
MSMAGFRSPLDAYREDLSRAQGRKRLASDDEFWIILATGLRRLAQAPARSRPAAARRLSSALVTFAKELASRDGSNPADGPHPEDAASRALAVADALAQFSDPGSASALVAEVRGLAADAEEAGAVILAREILTDIRQVAAHARTLERGLVLLQLGRIARTLGNLDGALDLLRAAGDLGRADGVPELLAREAVGEAVVARTRGNYPAARVLFERALEAGSAIGLADVVGLSHHGLMIVTSEAGEFDAALRHGWRALSAARSQQAREAEMMANLAELCVRAGYDTAALGGFAAALARTSAPRIRLPALAGIAEAAARLGVASRVETAARAIEAEASQVFPYETARAWLSLARARRILGDSRAADAAAERATVIARAHGFFEVTHRIAEEARPKPATLSTAGREVIKSLEVWSSDPSAQASLSSASTG